MDDVSLIGDARANPEALRAKLAGVVDINFEPIGRALHRSPGASTLFDIDLNDESLLINLKDWLRRKPAHAKAIFLTDKTSHLQQARAYALGATDILHRPLDPRMLLVKLWGDIGALSAEPDNIAIRGSAAVSAAVDTLENIFSSACLGGRLDTAAINDANHAVVSDVEAHGLTAWIDAVRTHHSMTYQHCLLVTGVAVAFGQHIGLSHKDRRRLSFAGMLHDIGKARIPLAILEKPGPLDRDEMAVMKNHPQFGLDALSTVPGLPPEMLDMVVHHHEYLDGSGYPHGLHANEISDLLRMITISDIFGALIERRSYKPPLSGSAAYKILVDMGPKLDKDLLRAFEPVTHLGLQQ